MEYRYRKTSYRCSECKFSFDKVRKFPISKHPHGTDLPFPKKDPDCPQCKRTQRVSFKSSITDDTHKHINPNSAEASFIGGTPDNPIKAATYGGRNNFTKAWDATQEMVSQDYQMTDLNTNLRSGDSMAPKLAPHLEQQVDQVFKANKPIMGQNTATTLNKSLTAQINAGKYAGQSGARDITQRVQNSGYKVPTNIIHEHKGKPN